VGGGDKNLGNGQIFRLGNRLNGGGRGGMPHGYCAFNQGVLFDLARLRETHKVVMEFLQVLLKQ
jgi:hypothetical protein